MNNLPECQIDVLRLTAHGYANDEICQKLGLTYSSVKHNRARSHAWFREQFPFAFDNERTISSALPSYVLGLVDGGLTNEQIADRLREVRRD